jgi:hypothetical protein
MKDAMTMQWKVAVQVYMWNITVLSSSAKIVVVKLTIFGMVAPDICRFLVWTFMSPFWCQEF